MLTFKDLKKKVSLVTQRQNKFFERLQNKPFWIWNIDEHKLKDVITNGDCCFNHIIGLPQKDGNDKPLYDYEQIIFDSLNGGSNLQTLTNGQPRDGLPVNETYKLLFFDIKSTWELKIIKDYWRKKTIESIESEVSGDEPWYTAQYREQTLQQSRFLKQIDQQTSRWRDLESMNFKPEVLDKYKNNQLCSIGSDHI